MTSKPALPENFNALEYVETMQPYIGLDMDEATQQEVSKLVDVAYNMAQVVYAAPVDDNEIELANVFKAGAHR